MTAISTNLFTAIYMLHLNLSPLWSPLAFGPTVVPSAHELLKNVTQLWKINKNDKIPLPESP